MTQKRTADSSSNPTHSMSSTRRRPTLRDLQASSIATNNDVMTPKIIDARPSLKNPGMYGMDDQRPTSSRMMAWAGRLFIETIPQWMAAGVMLALIFGGCCSNVFALEAIVKVEPDSGTLLTFVQFLFVATTGYISQFDRTNLPFFLKPNRVPISRWLVNILLFFTINVLNNHAFSYNISVPIHIILRSGGSITTLVAGYIWGKRFSRTQVVAVILLTVGVIIAAWSDQQSKVRPLNGNTSSADNLCRAMSRLLRDRPPFSTGLAILFLAQVLSAIMGLYTEETYRQYGPHWKENLFYSHLLALPLFIPFLPSMYRQLLKLAASTPLGLPAHASLSNLPVDFRKGMDSIHIPSQLAFLILNVLTQYACIRGVNLLASAASALTVTIVLNVRKLISLLLSIWLFGNKLSSGTLVGAFIVFSAGGLYGFQGGNKAPGRGSHRASVSNGKVG